MGLFDLFKKKEEVPMSDLQILEMKKEDFMFNISDVFMITGRGTCVTGVVTSGMIMVNDLVVLRKLDGTELEVTVLGIEKFRKTLEVGYKGENLGILINNVTKDQITPGDMLIKKKF